MTGNLSYILELTKVCNNNCKYCYNVWKADTHYPCEELSSSQWQTIIDKIILETKPQVVGLSGGEPLTRKDFFEILAHLKKHHLFVNLITNGTLLNRELIKKCHAGGVDMFELPLLSSSPKIHDELTRNPGAWQKVIENISEIKKQGASLAVVMVLTKQNIFDAKATAEIAIALGADSILCNRFNIGGMGIRYKNELFPSLEELDIAYSELNNLAKEYEININSGIPLPPCILDPKKYEKMIFSQCQIGGPNPYYAIDPAGNLRPCNHSSLILGNLLESSVKDLLTSEKFKQYSASSPQKCQGCREQKNQCRGGCMASAEVYYKDCSKPDPFVFENFKHRL